MWTNVRLALEVFCSDAASREQQRAAMTAVHPSPSQCSDAASREQQRAAMTAVHPSPSQRDRKGGGDGWEGQRELTTASPTCADFHSAGPLRQRLGDRKPVGGLSRYPPEHVTCPQRLSPSGAS
ncbi:unnamed protein product [Arctogadus glacialis]